MPVILMRLLITALKRLAHWVLVGVGTIVFVFFLPTQYYLPGCYTSPDRRSLGTIEIAADYRAHLKSALAVGQADRIVLGDIIFVRILGDPGDWRFRGHPTLAYLESNAQIDIAKWVWANPGAVSPQGYVHLYPRKYEIPRFFKLTSFDRELCETVIPHAIDATNWRRATPEELAGPKRVPFPRADLHRWFEATQDTWIY